MDALSLLLNRNSAAKLVEPAPSGEALKTMLQAALRSPDHARLRPWRFLLVEGEAREKLGEVYAQAELARNSVADEAVLARLRKQPTRAPLIIVVVATLQEHPKVPREEQLLSAGCAAHSILLAAQAQGFAGIWRTGTNAYDRNVCKELGLESNEEIVGFLYLGSINGDFKKLPDLNAEDFCQNWT
jgi:nitroreductase